MLTGVHQHTHLAPVYTGLCGGYGFSLARHDGHHPGTPIMVCLDCALHYPHPLQQNAERPPRRPALYSTLLSILIARMPSQYHPLHSDCADVEWNAGTSGDCASDKNSEKLGETQRQTFSRIGENRRTAWNRSPPAPPPLFAAWSPGQNCEKPSGPRPHRPWEDT